MAIVVGGRRYVTLNDDIRVNGTKILEAYANGVKVYPERSIRLEGNPYVVKYCGSATFAFDQENYCALSSSGLGAYASRGWFTLSVAYSVVLALYTDSARAVVMGDTYSQPGIQDRDVDRNAIVSGAISKAIVLDMTTMVQSTNWSVPSPTGNWGMDQYGRHWFTPAGFASMFSGVHHSGGADEVVSGGVLLALTGKGLCIPDRLVTSDAIHDPVIINDIESYPSVRDHLTEYLSAENLHVTFTISSVSAPNNQILIKGVNVETSEMVYIFTKGGVFGTLFSHGGKIHETRQQHIPIADILYCGLASDLEREYDFTTSEKDFEKRK